MTPPGGALVVSIHDVSPLTRPAVEIMLADLARAGVRTTSLLVIPDHHGQADSAADPTFVSWLATQAAAGHEIVAHGHRHRREPREGERWIDRFFTRHYTAGEGEFYDISQVDALALLGRVREWFARMGFAPRGFIAPAWLLSPGAEAALPAAGFDYTVRLRTVRDLRTGATWHTQSLVYSTRAAWRRAVSLLWNSLLFALNRTAPLLRISSHPPDLTHAAIWRQTLRFVRRAASTRTATTYGEWITRHRPDGAAGDP